MIHPGRWSSHLSNYLVEFPASHKKRLVRLRTTNHCASQWFTIVHNWFQFINQFFTMYLGKNSHSALTWKVRQKLCGWFPGVLTIININQPTFLKAAASATWNNSSCSSPILARPQATLAMSWLFKKTKPLGQPDMPNKIWNRTSKCQKILRSNWYEYHVYVCIYILYYIQELYENEPPALHGHHPTRQKPWFFGSCGAKVATLPTDSSATASIMSGHSMPAVA